MTAPPTQHIIDATGLQYRFPGPDGLTLGVPEFRVSPAEHTAIIGPSGCGKTTLLRLIAGIILPTSGSLRTLGVRPADLSPAARGRARLQSIGMVFQDFALLEYLSALDNMLLSARLAGLDRDEARERARDLADRAGVTHTLRRKPRRMSQGERQRVAVCRALLPSPKLILCDEPTGNLDPTRSGEIVDLLLDEASQIGATIVNVTHDPSVLDRFSRLVGFEKIGSIEGGDA